MNLRKLAVLGVFALLAAMMLDTEAQAFGKRKRNQNNCNTCQTPAAPCNTCGGGYAQAPMPTGGVPYAMPMPASNGIVPASGTVTQPQPGTSVVPAGGFIPNNGLAVVPAGSTYSYPTTNATYYYDPTTGNYYLMNQGTTATQRRGLFRR